MTSSGDSPTVVREAVSASSPIALRSAHTAVRKFARAAAPALAGHRCAATAARSWGLAHSKKGEQPADRGQERELLAVAFGGHCAQQPHLEHALTISPSHAAVCAWALTLR